MTDLGWRPWVLRAALLLGAIRLLYVGVEWAWRGHPATPGTIVLLTLGSVTLLLCLSMHVPGQLVRPRPPHGWALAAVVVAAGASLLALNGDEFGLRIVLAGAALLVTSRLRLPGLVQALAAAGVFVGGAMMPDWHLRVAVGVMLGAAAAGVAIAGRYLGQLVLRPGEHGEVSSRWALLIVPAVLLGAAVSVVLPDTTVRIAGGIHLAAAVITFLAFIAWPARSQNVEGEFA